MRVGSGVREGAVGLRTQESGNVCHLRMVNLTLVVLSASGQDQTRAGGGGTPAHSRDVLRCTAAIRARSTACAVIALWGFHSQAVRAKWRPRDQDVVARASLRLLLAGEAGSSQLPR
jgi:hypothetical protein